MSPPPPGRAQSSAPTASKVPRAPGPAWRMGRPGLRPHPRGAAGLRARSGISAGSGRNVAAAGTMPAPCAGPLGDGAGSSCPGTALLSRSQQEADGDDTGGRFLRQDARAFSTAAPVAEPAGPGVHGQRCSSLQKPLCRTPAPAPSCAHSPRPRAVPTPPAAPSLVWRVPGPSAKRATGAGLHVAHVPGAHKLLPGSRSKTSRNQGKGNLCRCPPALPSMLPRWRRWESWRKDSAAFGRLQPLGARPGAPGTGDGGAEPQLCVMGCCSPAAAATPRPRGTELRERQQARCEHPAWPRKTLHNGGLFGTNSFPINYVI